MGRLIHWPSLAIALSFAAAVGGAVRWVTGLSFWAAFGLVIIGMIVNGFIATWEDHRPGGFNNPD
jgi:hypothetical protein